MIVFAFLKEVLVRSNDSSLCLIRMLSADFIGTGIGPTSMAPLLFFIPGKSAHKRKDDSDVEPNSVASYQVVCALGSVYLIAATALLYKIKHAR